MRDRSIFGEVPAHWSIRNIGDLTTKIGSGATPTGGEKAYLPKRDHFALIRSQCVHDRRFDVSSVSFITDEQAKRLGNASVQPGDVLLNITGDGVTFARSAQVPASVLPAYVNQHVSIIRANPDLLLPGYLLAFLTHPNTKPYIEAFSSGGSRRAITKGHIQTFELPLPPLEEQSQIVEVLGSLDDKIELNRRMNETLEAMAQAIFRDWFVDFGPTRRKIDGATDPVEIMGGLVADPDRARELARLFPASIGDDGLPEGWKMRAIYSEANVIYGAPFASKRFNTMGIGRPLARIRDLPNHRGGLFTEERHSKEYIIRPGDIVVGMDGEFRAYLWHGVDTLMNQRVCCFAPIELENRAFVYFSIKPLLERSENSAVGTTVIHLGKKDIDRFVVVNPGTALKAAFAAIAQPLMARLVANGEQIRTLTATRDLLLPKLMSGEIRLDEAPAQAEAAE